jgi:mannosyltransferase
MRAKKFALQSAKRSARVVADQSLWKFTMRNSLRIRYILALVLILLAAGVLRFYRLDARDLWYDEIFTYDVSQNSIPQLLYDLSRDTSPPLYFLMLKYWAWIWGSVVNLRSLSVVWALLGVWGAYLLGSQLFSRGIGLYAALLVAVNPFHIYYSQELRMYTAYTTLLLFGAYFLTRGISRQNRRDWLLAGVFNALALYTHYHAIFFILGEYLFVWYVAKAGDIVLPRKRIFESMVVTGLSALPLLPLVVVQANNNLGKIAWISTPLLSDLPRSFVIAFSYYFYATREAWWMWAVYGALFCALLWGNWGIWRDKATRSAMIFLLCTAIFPVVLMFVLSYSRVKFFLVSRFIIISLIPFLLLLSALLIKIQLRTKWLKALLLAVFAINSLAFASVQDFQNNKPHWRKLTKIVDLEVNTEDPLLAVEDYWMNGYFYYSNRDHPIIDFGSFMERSTETPSRIFLLQYNKTVPEDAVFPRFLLDVLDQCSTTSVVLFQDDWYTFSLHEGVDFERLRRWYSLRENAARQELSNQHFLAFLGAESESLENNSTFGSLQIDGEQSPYRWTIGEKIAFHFPLAFEPGLYLLGLKARFPHPKQITDYHLEVEVNGCFQERRKAVSAYSPFYFYVQIERPQSALTVSCRSSTWIPKAYGLGNDERPLGFHFHWLSWAHADMKPFHKDGYLAFYDIGSPDDTTLVNERWYAPEAHGQTTFRWTWHTAVITLPLPEEAEQVKMLILNFISKFPDVIATPMLKISINEIQLPPIMIENGWVERSIRVPPVFRPGPNKVRLMCPAWVPAEVSDSKDWRELGIQVNWIALR